MCRRSTRGRSYAAVVTMALLLWGPLPSRAAFEYLSFGARPTAMAGAYVGYARGPEALVLNPAGIAGAVGLATTAAYSRPFGLKELDASSISIQYPLRLGGVGLAARQFGRTPYQEQVLCAGAGFIVMSQLYVGVAAHFYHLRIASYGAASTLGLDVGMLMPVSPTINWGVTVRNLNRPRIGECHEQLPQVLATGLSITPVMPLVVTVDLHKDVRYPAELRLGAAYQPLSALVVRCGVQTNPGRFAAGLGLWLGPLRLDYAASYHYDLGLSHAISVTIGTE